MKALVLVVLLPFMLATLLVFFVAFVVGAAVFGPLVSMAGISELPSKFFDYAK